MVKNKADQCLYILYSSSTPQIASIIQPLKQFNTQTFNNSTPKPPQNTIPKTIQQMNNQHLNSYNNSKGDHKWPPLLLLVEWFGIIRNS